MFERNSYFDSTARVPGGTNRGRYVTYDEIPFSVHSKNIRFLYDVFQAFDPKTDPRRAYLQTIAALEKEILGAAL